MNGARPPDFAPLPAAVFEENLAREIAQSERTRMAILAGLFALLIVVFPLFAWLFREHYLRYFNSGESVAYTVGISALLVAYELLAREFVGWRLARGLAPPPLVRYGSAFVETSVPTILMLIVGSYAHPIIVLQGPVAFLYAVFIVLSTLRLDFRLSAFTGFVAAAEFVALSFHFAREAADLELPAVLTAPAFVLMKGVMLLLAGVAAGFVAAQLRRRIIKAFHVNEERQRIVNAFGQQVSPEVVDELLRRGPEIASRRSFVCIMFMDVRDFTRLTTGSSPEEIVAIQNALFGAATKIVNRHRGIINQFLGDGFMATFGAPLSGGNDCRNALAAAREMLVEVIRLGETGRTPALAVGIGLHAGEAVSGNIGSEQRKQYSITGEVVILASRIEQLNKAHGSRLLVSEEVLKAAGEDPAGAIALGPVQVRGREAPLAIYRLA